MSYSRVKRHQLKKSKKVQVIFGMLATGLTVGFTTESVNTDSYTTNINKAESLEAFSVETIETTLPFSVEASMLTDVAVDNIVNQTTNVVNTVATSTYDESSMTNVVAEEAYYSSVQETATYGVTYDTATSTASSYSGTLSNGNTAGAVGTEAAAQMAAATGVSQETWEYIIARESNGNPTVANASGASGLFQTMPGWGSTATVQDQINSAINAYNSQGLAAWGMQ